MQLNPGEVQLNVGGILLDVETTSIIDDIAFNNGSFTLTMSSGNTFNVSSADRKKFIIDPTTYVKVTFICATDKSSLHLQPTQDSGAITVTITPTGTCTVGGDGGGGGGAAGAIGVMAPSLILAPTPILIEITPAVPPPKEKKPLPCLPNWGCAAFGECLEGGVQIRECTDFNRCGTTANRPEQSRRCEYIPPHLTEQEKIEAAEIEKKVKAIIKEVEVAGIDVSSADPEVLKAVAKSEKDKNVDAATADSEALGVAIGAIDEIRIDITTVDSMVVGDVIKAVEALKAEGIDVAADKSKVFTATMKVFEAATPVSVENTIQAVQSVNSGIAKTASAVNSGAIDIIQGAASGSTVAPVETGIPNTQKKTWDTDKLLKTKGGRLPFTVTEGNDYKIIVASTIEPSIQDASDAPFKFTSGETSAASAPLGVGAFNKNSKSAFLSNLFEPLFSNAIIARAQENPEPSIKIIFPNGGETLIVGKTYELVWESNLPEDHPIAISKDFKIAESIKAVNSEVQKNVKELRSTPVVTKTIKSVAPPVSAAVSTASAGAVTVTASAGSATIAMNITEFFQSLGFARFYLLGLIRFKRKKPWGKVYDKLTGNPIRSATVQIYDAEYKKIKDTQITDSEGRFNSLISPGKYYLKVLKEGFETEESKVIDIASSDQILNIEIALSPIKEFSFKYLKKINLWNAIRGLMELINPYLLAFGTIVSIVAVIIVPNMLNYIAFIIYIALDIIKIYLAFHLIKPFGKVIDQITQKPMPLSVVRIFNKEKNWLLATKVTDNQGRFDFLLAPGEYYFSCAKTGYVPFNSDTFTLKKFGLVAIDIKMRKI